MELFQLSDFGLTASQWGWLLLCGLLIGLSKSGVQGAGTVVVPIMAYLFGGKPSTGFLLPMLCIADLFAVLYYRRSARWDHLIRLLPWTVAGFFLALWVDKFVPAAGFKHLIGISILPGIVILIWNETRNKEKPLPDSIWISIFFGVLGGFSTMIGNAAGPIMALYLLSMHLPKISYVGTGAWFFLIVNLMKVPLQIHFWDNITWHSFSLNLLMVPAIAAGIYLGIRFVKFIPEIWFRRFVLVATLLSALLLLLP